MEAFEIVALPVGILLIVYGIKTLWSLHLEDRAEAKAEHAVPGALADRDSTASQTTGTP